MRQLFIIPIEPLDNRYTKQWFTWIPNQLREMYPNYVIKNIEGKAFGYDAPTAGAFFDFAYTCKYKASQVETIADMFGLGIVNDGDIFFFADAWNPAINFVKYMAELKQINIKMAGIWHAGHYDPTDLLGTTIKNDNWAYNLEESLFHALDLNFFGTQHHLNVFRKDHSRSVDNYPDKVFVVGYPLDYIAKLKNDTPKERIVVFPHRLSPDKQPDVFDQLAEAVRKEDPTIVFVKTQDHNLSKEEYYNLLKRCSIVFSASKHENLGIGIFEAMMAGCIPLVPDRLSYHEMYSGHWKYSFNYTISDLVHTILYGMDHYQELNLIRTDKLDGIQEKFFSGKKMFELLGTL